MKSLEQLDRWMASKIKGWTVKFSGQQELLEVRRDILEEIRGGIEPRGAGKSVFPYNTIEIRIAAQDEHQREVCEAAFAEEDGIAADIRELLAEAGCTLPRGFRAAVEIVDDPKLAWSGRPFRVECSTRKGSGATARLPSARPRARLSVVAGDATSRECQIVTDRFYLGRLSEVVGEKDGLRRRNDLAFAETETTVSREHAYIRYDSGTFRLYDTHSQRGTRVFRGGRRIDVPRGAAGGVQLRSGDEIHLGNARVLFEIEEG